MSLSSLVNDLATRIGQEIKDVRTEITGERTATATLTNKRITKRVVSTASTATLTVNSDTTDVSIITAQAAGLTVAAPSGTPTDGQMLLLRITDNGTARAITWNAIFRVFGVTLPTTTVIGKTIYVLVMWNAQDSTWDVLDVTSET